MCSALGDIGFVPIADTCGYLCAVEFPPPEIGQGEDKPRSGRGDVPDIIEAVTGNVTRFAVFSPSV